VNTALDPARIRKGNEDVMRARLSDARFFVHHDRATRLVDRVPRLDGVVFHQKLGSQGDRVRRLEAIVPAIATAFGADVDAAKRAALLCKADLVSLSVGEFPELQGVMGRDGALHDGEPEQVAHAIAEHYEPRSAEDAVAPSKLGASLAAADRLDTLVSFFAIGHRPAGGGDPFGLRRAAIGLLRTSMHHRVRFALEPAIERAYTALADQCAHATPPRTLARSAEDTRKELGEFARERLEGLLLQSHPLDVVRACLAAGADDPVDVLERVEALAALRTTPDFPHVVRAFERVFNISRGAPSGEPDASVLVRPEERALVAASDAARPRIRENIARREFTAALRVVAETLPTVVDRFFDAIFVMDDDQRLREARLRLLGRIADEVGVIARFDTLAASSRESVPSAAGN
jgi:glycyl-tRNA synthetase beta chain